MFCLFITLQGVSFWPSLTVYLLYASPKLLILAIWATLLTLCWHLAGLILGKSWWFSVVVDTVGLVVVQWMSCLACMPVCFARRRVHAVTCTSSVSRSHCLLLVDILLVIVWLILTLSTVISWYLAWSVSRPARCSCCCHQWWTAACCCCCGWTNTGRS